MVETALESFLLGHPATTAPRPKCRLVVGGNPLRFQLDELRDAVTRSAAGDLAAYAVPLDGAPLARLLTLITLATRLRRAQRVIERNGGATVCRYGVDPQLNAPAFVYQLDSAAAQYAESFLRDRGSGAAIRRIAARCFGYDPAIGAIVVMGRKS
ncbi:MAG: hypothetical protein ABI868_04420 [Acidobacteriota bacterium]